MKREVERVRKIPAFSIDIGEFEVLWDRIISLFDSNEKIYSSINITLPAEKLDFDNLEDLKQYTGLKGKVSNVDFWVSQNGNRVSIRAGHLFYTNATVSATGETEAWCAGAVETVFSFLQSYKVWYYWLVSAPLGWILIFMINIPTLMSMVNKGEVTVSKYIVIGWASTLATLIFLYVFKKKLFPATVLVISEEESFVRKHSAELGLIIALLSSVLIVVGWFVGRGGA